MESNEKKKEEEKKESPEKAEKLGDLFRSAKKESKEKTDAAGKALSTRQATFGSMLVVSLVALLGILVLVNVIVHREGADWRKDMTEDRQFSLSDKTQKVLGALDEDVRVLGFYSSQYPNRASVENLLNEYRAKSDGHLSFEMIDPQRTPAIAQQYQVTRDGTLVFILGEKQEAVIGTTETDLTRGLVKVTRDEQKTVVFTGGHQEKDPLSTTQEGYALLNQLLGDEGYETSVVSLVAEDIPEGTDVLVVAGPRKRFAGAEVDKVKAYVEGGGKLFLLVDPFTETNIRFTEFDEMLATYGVEHQEGLVIDPAQSLPQDVQAPFLLEWGMHQITEGLGGGFFAGVSRIDTAAEPVEGYRTSVLASSSESSWLETDFKSQQVSQGDGDLAGPVSMAVAVEPFDATGEADLAGKPRLVVMGDSDFAVDLLLPLNPLNQDLFLNSVNWLADEADLISIRPKEMQQRTVSFSNSQSQWVFWMTVVGMPGIVVLAAIIVFVRRRKRTA